MSSKEIKDLGIKSSKEIKELSELTQSTFTTLKTDALDQHRGFETSLAATNQRLTTALASHVEELKVDIKALREDNIALKLENGKQKA